MKPAKLPESRAGHLAARVPLLAALAAAGLVMAFALPAMTALAAGAPGGPVQARERNEVAGNLPIRAGAPERFDPRRVAVSSGAKRAKAGGSPVTVNTPLDVSDGYGCPGMPGGDGLCSLREAISYVNSQTCSIGTSYPSYTIDFSIAPGSVISLATDSPLPPIGCNNLLIDAETSGGVVIDGSALSSFGSGIAIEFADAVEVRGLTVTGMPSNGIETFCGGWDSLFVGNTLTDNGGFGISIGDFECGEVNNTVIEGNTITGNAAGGILASGYFFGGAFSEGKRQSRAKGSLVPNRITRNLVSGNGGAGLRIDGDGNTLIGSMDDPSLANQFVSNLGPGVEVVFGSGGHQFGINQTSGNSSGVGFDVSLDPQLADGANPNDPGDQAPPQNHPVLSSASFDTATSAMRLQGALDTGNPGPFKMILYGGSPAVSYEAGPYLGQAPVTAGGPFDVTIPYDPLQPALYGGITGNVTSMVPGAQSSELSAAFALPVVSQDKTAVDFGAVALGGSAVQTVIVSGATGFALAGVQSAIPGVTVDASACAAPAGPTCAITLTYAPQSTTPITGFVDFTSNSAGLRRLSVSGSGTVSLIGLTLGFSPASVIVGTPSVFSVTLTNPNAAPFSSSGFSYALPAGLAIPPGAAIVNPAGPCGGTLTPIPDGLSFTVTSVAVPTAGSCTFSVEVAATAPATYTASMAPGTIVGAVLSQPNVTNANATPASLTVVPVPAPVLAVSPAPPGPIDFGSVTVGSVSGAQVVTLTNTGNATLLFSGPPAAAAPFVVNTATATPCASSLAPAPGPGNSCTVEVRFAPTAVGAASGTLSVASNGGSASLDLLGSGSAVPVPGIGLAPTSLAFPSQAVGTSSAPLAVTLQNTGTAPLTITSIGTTLGDFGQSTNCPIAPATLAAGATCSITVTFSPLLEGDRIGTLDVASNAAQGSGQVALSGFGAPAPVPAVSVQPGTLAFPATQVNTAAAPLAVTVTNAGGAPLSILAVEIVGAGFGVSSSDCVGTLAAGSSCTVTVVFAPTTTGTIVATLRIASNAPASPTFVGLSGTSTAAPVAALSATPASLAFGTVEVGLASAPQSVTISNTGGAAATITGITLSGDYAQSSACSVVPPGGSCTVTVTFTPTGSGSRPGSLAVASDASGGPVTVALSGSGTPPPVPVIELSATSLSFGNTIIGRSSGPQAVTVRNVGGAPLVISGIAGPFEFPVGSGCGAPVAAGESCRLDVGFLPSVPGARPGRIEVRSNASNGTAGVGVSGTGCRFSFLNRNVSLICQ